MLSQREKFVCSVVSSLGADTGRDFMLALTEVLREGKCDELSVAETNELIDGIQQDLEEKEQIIKDTIKKLES